MIAANIYFFSFDLKELLAIKTKLAISGDPDLPSNII
jgi:hypothetical protein